MDKVGKRHRHIPRGRGWKRCFRSDRVGTKMAKTQKVKAKIGRIQHDLAHSKGLTEDEIILALKAGLTDPEQAWFRLKTNL
jgi:hypothetical protein